MTLLEGAIAGALLAQAPLTFTILKTQEEPYELMTINSEILRIGPGACLRGPITVGNGMFVLSEGADFPAGCSAAEKARAQ